MYGHSSSLVEDCIIIIGGLNSTSANSYVLRYNITSNTWDSLETFGGTKPASKNVDHIIYNVLILGLQQMPVFNIRIFGCLDE